MLVLLLISSLYSVRPFVFPVVTFGIMSCTLVVLYNFSAITLKFTILFIILELYAYFYLEIYLEILQREMQSE